jgi:hypothetical protein
MKSTKKLKAGQLKLPTLPHLDKSSYGRGDLPEADNPFVTRDELSNVMNALTEDFTDYNYNITGEK